MNIAGLRWESIATVGTLMAPMEFGATLQTLTRDGSTALCLNVKRQMKMLAVKMRQLMAPTTLGRQIQPWEASPARRGLSNPIQSKTGHTWEITTIAGTPTMTQMVYGAPPQTLTLNGTTALCLCVRWKKAFP